MSAPAIFATAAALFVCPGVAPAAAQQPSPADQAPADPLVFNSDRMLVIVRVAEANAIDFEVTMGRVKEVLNQSDKPERKKQAAHWKMLKATTPQDGVLNYFFILEEVVKGASYDPFKILGEALPPEEVKALFDKVGPGLRGISAAPLGPIVNMGSGG
jgi:hypothetical protein